MHLLGLSLCVLRHPVDCFRIVQRDRKQFSFTAVLLLYALLIGVRLLFIQTVHYPLQVTDPRYANWIMEAMILLVPLLSLAVCAFAISSIMDGEMMMRESLTAVIYAMMPYIVLSLPLSLLSHLLGQGDALFNLLQIFIWAWCIILYIVSYKVMNSYTFAKTVLTLILTILLIALMWAVCLLVYALWNQLVTFITGLYREIKFIIRR